MLDSRSDPREPEEPREAAAFDRIEAALSESERGRRFLAELARRHRGADTRTLLQAIARIESVVTQNAALQGTEGHAAESYRGASGEGLAALSGTIARARAEIAAMGGADRPAPAMAFEAIVPAAGRAGADILAAAEGVQEVAWTLRDKGAEAASCDGLDRRAAEIHAACAAHDLTTRRTARALRALCDLEQAIAAVIAGRPPGSQQVSKPAALPPLGDDIAFAESVSDIPPAGPQPPAAIAGTEDLAAAFADLDRLSIEEKIALFS